MAKALKIASVVLAVGALAIVTGGAAVGLGLSIGTSFLGVSAGALFLASAGLSAAGSLLAPRPKAPQASSATADRLTVSIDARTPRKFAFGRTALATDLRDQEYSGDQTFLDRFIVVAAHKVQSIDEIWFDDYLAWSSSAGVTGKAVGYLQVDAIEEGSPDNAIVISDRMGSSRRYTGCAYVRLRYRLKGLSKTADSPFAQSIPTRVTIVGRGAALYDPRLDSTAGGDGPHRADDQTTWTWSDTSSRNPALALLWYLLGYRIRNPVTGEWKLSVGQSIPVSRIDLESFIDAANLCDEPVQKADGTYEPRYRCDGLFSEGDQPKVVLDALKATMNAVLDDNDGRLRLTVLHNDLATPAAALTTDDVLGEFRWDQTPPLSETFNVVRGSYTDPSPLSLYQQIDAPEVRIPSPDGIERVETVNLPTVQSASQKQRLDKQRVRRMLYSGTFSATFQATAWRYQKGDVVPFTFAPLGWVNKLFRVVDMTVQVDGRVPMVLRVEHPSIYADDGTETAPIDGVEPTRYDQNEDPIRRRLALLANAVERGLFDALAIYVAGNVVALEDGSRWLCVAATAAVGNRPSGVNSDWSLLQGAVGVVPADTVIGGTLDPVSGVISGGAPAASLAPALIALDKAIDDIDAANAEADLLAETTRKALTEGLAAQLLGEARKDRLLALTHLDGLPVGPVIKRVDQERREGDTALAESVTIVRAAIDDEIETRAADVTRIDRAIVDQGSVQAQALATVRAELQGGIDDETETRVADVTRLDRAIVDQGSVQAQALATVRAELQGGIDDEIETRVADVTRLDRAIVDQGSVQAQALATVRAELQGGIDDEIETRVADVTRLDRAIVDQGSVQAQALATVRAELQGGIDDETETRVADVTRLDRAFVDEREARARAISDTRVDFDGKVASVLDMAEAAVDAVGKVTATRTIAVDANGNISGFQLVGSEAGPGALGLFNTDLKMGEGRIICASTTHMTVHGIGFGTAGQFLEWYGPIMPIGQCAEGNGIAWKRRDGRAYTRGALVAGTISNAVQTTSTASNASVTTGPVGSNGGQRIVVVSYTLFVARQHTDTSPPASGTARGVVKIQRNGSDVDTLIAEGEWQRTQSFGDFEPGSYSAYVSGAKTFYDNSGGSSVSYSAYLVQRDAGPGAGDSADDQTISIVQSED